MPQSYPQPMRLRECDVWDSKRFIMVGLLHKGRNKKCHSLSSHAPETVISTLWQVPNRTHSFQKKMQNFTQHVLCLRHLQSMDGNFVPTLPSVQTRTTQNTTCLRCWRPNKRPQLQKWHGRPENHVYMAVECCNGLLLQQHIEACTARAEMNGSYGRFWQNATEHL